MPTLMTTFTVSVLLEDATVQDHGETIANLLVDVLQAHCPEVMPDLIGFLLLKTLDTVYITLKTQHSAEKVLFIMGNLANLSQQMKRILGHDGSRHSQN